MSDLAELNSMMKKRNREKLRCAFDVSEGANAYDGLGCYKGKVIFFRTNCFWSRVIAK